MAPRGTKRKSDALEPEIEDLGACLTEQERSKAKRLHDASSVSVHHHAWADHAEVEALRTLLLTWYGVHRRHLPWRGDAPPFIATAEHTKKQDKLKSKRGPLDAFFGGAGGAKPTKDKTNETEADKQSVLNEVIAPSRTVSPYETWVSEIMLQQTRVDTVIDYFVRWMERFPTVTALAEASDEDVNALWAGLGYYRRARMLHQGAQYVVEHFDGELPNTIEQLRSIPGIGPYTAGAIASIAFGLREPLVDGNVIRVMARLRAIGADPKNKSLIDFSWSAARTLVEHCDRPGALNQALMELGATACNVQTPACESCPVQSLCQAYAKQKASRKQRTKTIQQTDTNTECDLCDFTRHSEWDGSDKQYAVTRFPLKARKAEPKKHVICVTVVTYSDSKDALHFLMVRRPDNGLLAGQWEFVQAKVADGERVPSYSKRKSLIEETLVKLLGNASTWNSKQTVERRDLGELVHVFSHIKHFMGIEHIHFRHKPSLRPVKSKDVRWLQETDMAQVGITTGVKKILELVRPSKSSVQRKIMRGGAAKSEAQFDESRCDESDHDEEKNEEGNDETDYDGAERASL